MGETHALEFSGHDGRGRVVRTIAIDDDFLITVQFERIDVTNLNRAMDPALLRAMLRGSRIEQGGAGAFLNLLPELVDRDARHADLSREAIALPPFQCNVSRYGRDQKNERIASEVFQLKQKGVNG